MITSISEFAQQHASTKAKSDIVARWESRVVAQGLHLRGRAGAEDYIARYGKGMAAPKALGFAAVAREKGFPAFADRFTEEAYYLTTGVRASLESTPSAASIPLTSATPSKATERSSFGDLPQLLTAVTEDMAHRLAANACFGMQEKLDGERLMVRSTGGVIEAGAKNGLTRSLPLAIAEALVPLGDLVADGEFVRDTNTLHLFDLLECNGVDLRQCSYEERYDKLAEILTSNDRVQLVYLAKFRTEKEQLMAEVRQRGGEGIVLKNLEARYTPGDQHNDQFKYQFRSQIAAIVGDRNGAKNSVSIYVFDGAQRRELGNLTIPGRTPIPAPGSIVEVQYLYCHEGPTGKLAQPVFLNVRDDVSPRDCQASKLRVKNVAEELAGC